VVSPRLFGCHSAHGGHEHCLFTSRRAYAAKTPGDLEHAFSAMAKDRARGLDVTTSSMFFTERRRIANFALKQGLPMMAGARMPPLVNDRRPNSR